MILIRSNCHLPLKKSDCHSFLTKLEKFFRRLSGGKWFFFFATGLSSLRSQEQLDFLDEIDILSRSGIGEHISLLQIVVCGDQSSRKSSSLEAISGVLCPRKDTIGTRFVTELVPRKRNEEYAVVNIVPSSKRPEKEGEKFFEYRHILPSFDEIPTLIKGAKVSMGLNPHELGSLPTSSG